MADRPTLAQVAARAGVSTMTASYTYNRPQRVSAEARARVLAAAAELGYAGPDPHARSLRRGASRTIGVVLGEHLTYAFQDPQAAQFLAGVAGVCAEQGYGMTILPITGGPADVQRVHESNVDGLVVWTTVDGDPVLEAVVAGRRPAVIFAGPAVEGLPLIGIDDEAAARAVGTIAFRRAGRPAIVSFPLDRARAAQVVAGVATTGRNVPFPVTRARLRGFRAAARAAGREWSDVRVAVCARNSADEGERAARALLSDRRRRPDAIAAMSDQLAAGVLRAAEDLGLAVPTQLAVTGWDDDSIAERLHLSTVAQSLRDQGVACAEAVLGLAAPRDVSNAWRVVQRATTR